MAARWGAGEETLTACNMDFFPIDTLDETSVLSSGETLEALQSCLDPSILSMFEDTPTVETKGMDDESEATLLTALTEILDNVDDENLSPFDTLPDSDLLSGQKGREHSPLRRLLCLSRSPPEKDTLCSARPLSAGKSLPRILTESLQRSDGEDEEDGSLSLSPVSQDSSPDNGLLDWEGLTLPFPVSHEQEDEDGVSVSLGDLVRHMHSYCMSISVENDDGEQMLPEGGILLEVVDQGENGEPILAIPDMNFPLPLSHEEQSAENEQKVSDEAEEVASDTSEHIVVDDEDESVSRAPVKVAAPVTPCQSLDETIAERPKEDIKERIPSRRKKKKKCKEQCRPEPAEGRVLRSGRVQTTVQVLPTKPGKKSIKEEKKQKIPKVTIVSTPAPYSIKPKKINPCQTEPQTITTEQLPVRNMQVATPVSPREETAPLNVHPEKSQPSCSPAAVIPQQLDELPQQPAPEKLEDLSAALSTVQPPVSSACLAAACSPITPPVIEALPPLAPAAPEPKPKSLSLAEYRQLRQQKKPAPVDKQDNNSTKWPSLPELPKELPPIPCLPDPSPREPRRPNPSLGKNELEEVRPAWQPRGPCAPPTPEALLAPPAYMVASSSKFSATTSVHRPQQKLEPSHPQKPSVANVPSHHHTAAQAAAPCVPQSSECPTSLIPTAQSDAKYFPAHVAKKDERPQPHLVSPKSVELTRTSPKTTTVPVKPTAAPSVPLKMTVQAPKVTAAALLNNPVTSDIKSSEPTVMQLSSSPAPHPSEPKTLKSKPVVLETKGRAPAAKNPTQELIESFTTEIGIEAADLTSLLEQFEETQAKVEHCVPEVSGRAAAVGNSSVQLAPEKNIVERVRAHDLSNTAALTPPATPPHQMWKPLAPVALLGKSKAVEASKSSPSKVIQIEARPLSSARSRSKPTPAAPTVAPEVACMDHDYCLPNKGTSEGEGGKRWNVKQQSFITIKPIKQSTTHTPAATPELLALSTEAELTMKTKEDPLDHRTDGMEGSSVLETPDASPARQETDTPMKEESPRSGPFGRSYRRPASSRTPSPRSRRRERSGGRSRKRRAHHSPSPMSSGSESDSHSSRSRSSSSSPYRKRYRPRKSESSSSNSSRSTSQSSCSASRSPLRRRRYSYSSSRSGSWSRSRSRSKSPKRSPYWSRGRRMISPPRRRGFGAKKDMEEMKRSKEKAIEERRVVYVGRIRGTMTQKELHERFSYFGEIEECTLHFRDHGDNYGFVTYYNTNDAFTAIENGSKLRKSDELPFDLCFGGRRQFCKSSYADLDSSREYDPLPAKGKFQALDFDTLLKQAQQKLKR